MKALLIPSWYPHTAEDPSGSFFREQAEILAGAGHEVSILALEFTSPDLRRPSSIRPALRGALRVDDRQEGPLRVLRCRLPKPVPGLQAPAVRLLIAAARRIARTHLDRPDVIHAHSVHPAAPIARTLAEDLGVPWMLTEHRPSSVTGTRAPAHERMIREALERAQVVSGVSGGLSRAMEERYGLGAGSVHVLANPLGTGFVSATSQLPSREVDAVTRFVHVSHLAPGKRIPELIAAFRAVRSDRPRELVIAGGSAQRVAEIAREHGAAVASDLPPRGEVRSRTGDDVVLVGHTPRERVPAVLASGDRFVLASAQESFGIVLAESLAVGVPVISTDTWGARDVVGEDPRRGRIVPSGDDEALRDAFEEAIAAHGDPSAARPGELREDVLSRYGPAAYARRVEELWRTAREPAPHDHPGGTSR